MGGQGGAIGVTSLKSSQKLLPYLREPLPASSRMDLLLLKDEPIRNDSNNAVVTYLRMEKSYFTEVIEARGVQNENK